MTTAPHPMKSQRLGLLFVLALPAGLAAAGCPHSHVQTQASASSAGAACVNMAARLKSATSGSCTVAQRICLIAGDLPTSIGQPDFVPAASYAARWQPHVRVWLAELTEIAKEPALASYAQGAQRKLEQVNTSEHDRGLIFENGDLLNALKVLGQKARTASPPIEISCPFPE